MPGIWINHKEYKTATQGLDAAIELMSTALTNLDLALSSLVGRGQEFEERTYQDDTGTAMIGEAARAWRKGYAAFAQQENDLRRDLQNIRGTLVQGGLIVRKANEKALEVASQAASIAQSGLTNSSSSALVSGSVDSSSSSLSIVNALNS